MKIRNPYCGAFVEVFWTGQVPVEVAQQAVGLVQACFVMGQVFGIPCLQLVAHPVKPKEATQATARRVSIDFITPEG